MRIAIAALVTALTVAGAAFAGPADSARSAAKAWLQKIDSGRYAQSWQDASPLFRSHVTEQKWAGAAKTLRTSLGAVEARTADAVRLAASLPGAPDGHYAVIRYETRFAHKAHAVETVTMMDVNGTWEGAGYFVR